MEGFHKSMMPKGLFLRFIELHERWLALKDTFTSWCTKCGEGGDDLLMCDRDGCGRVQHRSCSKLCDPDAQEEWFCDLCTMQHEQMQI